MLLLEEGRTAADNWQRLAAEGLANPLPAGNWLIPRQDWEAAGRPRPAKGARLALELEGDDDPEGLADLLPQLPLVAVRFPVATDGRGFSLLPWLRQLGYVGPVRATGDLRVDQLSALRRAGFASIELSDDVDLETAQRCLQRFGQLGTTPVRRAER
ncbi:uncharacterized protein (DUF934 family) [Alkalispirillum mobile]|uniref:Uncharacterized protein (DUF934 family) n=1 Tax=Alkalispirillum mobile TaxID=85925 RepID=A0A498C5F9_9GAMM|nr:DUF934 domain-containing protein [Alkalispirillum mobile]RLK50513.1 uncharacterized protein (DUF934 family) [Alkalispirillum mobile]